MTRELAVKRSLARLLALPISKIRRVTQVNALFITGR
jgi:hypothetical protein